MLNDKKVLRKKNVIIYYRIGNYNCFNKKSSKNIIFYKRSYFETTRSKARRPIQTKKLFPN
jgi:hypothetical protein